jgi:hypothetical protein
LIPSVQEENKENYGGRENALPTLFKERSHLGTGYCKTPPLKNKKTFNGNQEGSMLDLEPFPDES